MVLIWLAIFSPVIAVAAGIVYLIRRIDRKYRPVRKVTPVPEPDLQRPTSLTRNDAAGIFLEWLVSLAIGN